MEKNFIYKIIKNLNLKKINTRFPPEPNGCLHIGHVKSILLNYNISKEYNGNFILRFDDTNPLNEKKKFVQFIINDLFWLDLNFKISYTSNYYEFFYKKALFLIKNHYAYIDQLDNNEFINIKGNIKNIGYNNIYRNRNYKENIFLFKRMKNGFFYKNICLRAKIDMTSNSILLRDPVLYRIKFILHYRLKNTWCIYPIYDFAHCISDYIEKINFSLCTLEFIENKFLYNWIINILFKINKPIQIEFAKLNIENIFFSKSQISNLIEKKIFLNWNDPNLFTILGLRKRGITSNFIKYFCENIGINKKISYLKLINFETLLNKFLKKNTINLMCIINPIILIINNLNQDIKFLKILNNQNDFIYRTLFLTKKIFLNYQDVFILIKKKKFIFKLRYVSYIKIIKIIKNIFNKIVTLIGEIIYQNQYIKNINVLNWISKKYFIKCQLHFYENYSIFYKNLNNFHKNLIGYTELFVNYLLNEQTIQFNKIGYFVIFKKKNNIILNSTYLF